jgi:hypothetical protein
MIEIKFYKQISLKRKNYEKMASEQDCSLTLRGGYSGMSVNIFRTKVEHGGKKGKEIYFFVFSSMGGTPYPQKQEINRLGDIYQNILQNTTKKSSQQYPTCKEEHGGKAESALSRCQGGPRANPVFP